MLNVFFKYSTPIFSYKQLEISNQTLNRKKIKQPRLSIFNKKKIISNWKKEIRPKRGATLLPFSLPTLTISPQVCSFLLANLVVLISINYRCTCPCRLGKNLARYFRKFDSKYGSTK